MPRIVTLGGRVLQKYRLDFTTESGMWGGGVADVVEDDGNSVWGLLYSVTDDDLDRLDRYEGYPTKYGRLQATVEQGQGPVDDVWVYVGSRQEGFHPAESALPGHHHIRRRGVRVSSRVSAVPRFD